MNKDLDTKATISFKETCLLEVVVGSDENEEPVTEDRTFDQGETFEVDILTELETENGKFTSFQFADGNCVYSVPNKVIELL